MRDWIFRLRLRKWREARYLVITPIASDSPAQVESLTQEANPNPSYPPTPNQATVRIVSFLSTTGSTTQMSRAVRRPTYNPSPSPNSNSNPNPNP